MLTRVNGVGWMEEGGGAGGDNEEATSWPRSNPGASETKDEVGLTDFKSLLDDDWYIGGATATDPGIFTHEGFDALPTHYDLKVVSFSSNTSPAEALLVPPVDANFSCFPSSVFHLDPAEPFFPRKSALPSLLSSVCSNTFDTAFDLGSDVPGLLPMSSSPVIVNRVSGGGVLGLAGTGPGEQMGCPDLISGAQFPGAAQIMPPAPKNCHDSIFRTASNPFKSLENSPFLKGSNVLRPLEIFPPMGAQPTLFQKRKAALLQNNAVARENGGILGFLGSGGWQGSCGRSAMEEENDRNRKGNEEDEIDEASIGGSGLNYDTDDAWGESAKGNENAKSGSGGGGSNSNANSMGTGVGDEKGKKKGMPAKNLMAERRRRKKLNDRLYMLRSVVPKISKMDRASILGDAVDYLKELLQKINDLHNKLEPTPSNCSLRSAPTASIHPLAPTPPTLPCCVKEELGPSSSPSPSNQPAKVEVRVEGQEVSIHMFCARRPGLLLSTMRAFDDLGLDIEQAVISCFNGFALDVFQAEQCKDGLGVLPEEIKAALLQSAGFPSTM